MNIFQFGMVLSSPCVECESITYHEPWCSLFYEKRNLDEVKPITDKRASDNED